MRYATRLTLAMGLVVALACLAFSGVLYALQKREMLSGIDAQLLTAATCAKALLPDDYHDRLVDARSVTPEAYDRIVDRYNGLCRRLGLQYLWSCMVIDGRIVFTSSTSPGKDVRKHDHARFFEAHRDPASFAGALETMQTDYSSFRNQWGYGRQVLIPAVDRNGRKYCFGASMSVDDVYRALHRMVAGIVALSAAVLLLGLLATALLARSLARPVAALTDAAQAIAKGDLDHPVAAEGTTEVHRLSQTLNEMRLAIRDRIEALGESERKFRTLFENMTEGVALHEVVYGSAGEAVDYRILDVNPAYQAHTGLARWQIRGALASEAYGAGVPPYLAEWAPVARTGEPHVFETFFPPLNRHFRVSTISPKQGQFATVFEDISERKRKEEELQQRNEELARFTYTVSHDLKSPLVTIKAFLGYVEEDLPAGDAAQIATDLGYIRNAADRMGLLLDELLELSRIGRRTNPPVEATLQEVAGEAIALVAGSLVAGRVHVQVTEEPVVLLGDRPRLVEAYQNLIDNAAKFMGGQSSPRVEVGAEEEGGEIVLFVRDNGSGIDPRHQGKLFGLFEKLDPGSEGTGIGLALVKRIVEVHGGRIWVESQGLGQGATFRFTLAHTRRGSPCPLEREEG